jgi:hypothetical protein
MRFSVHTGPFGAQDEFILAATVQKLSKLAKLIPLPAPCLPERKRITRA